MKRFNTFCESVLICFQSPFPRGAKKTRDQKNGKVLTKFFRVQLHHNNVTLHLIILI